MWGALLDLIGGGGKKPGQASKDMLVQPGMDFNMLMQGLGSQPMPVQVPMGGGPPGQQLTDEQKSAILSLFQSQA